MDRVSDAVMDFGGADLTSVGRAAEALPSELLGDLFVVGLSHH